MSDDNSNFNADELEPPEWLNNEYMCMILKKSENDRVINIEAVEFSPATAKGDHFASIMFRAKIQYQVENVSKTKSIIIKIMPEVEGFKKDMMNNWNLFEVEINIYTKILPEFEQILAQAGDSTILGPRLLYSSLEPKKILVFEDLCPLGYATMRDRDLTLEEAKAAYLKLSKLHAVSYKLTQEKPHSLDWYQYGMFDLPNFATTDYVQSGIVNFLELLNEVPTLRQYSKYFEPLRHTLVTKVVTSYREYRDSPKENAYYLLSHGDFHIRNMMFKHNNLEQFEDVMLLDYQISNMGSIVIDMSYSIYLLQSRLLRRDHYDELLHYYFTGFVETLTAIGFKGVLPKYSEFLRQMREHRHIELFIFLSYLPMILGIKNNISGEDMMTDSEIRRQLFRNAEFIDEVHEVLPRYLYRGYLDFE